MVMYQNLHLHTEITKKVIVSFVQTISDHSCFSVAVQIAKIEIENTPSGKA